MLDICANYRMKIEIMAAEPAKHAHRIEWSEEEEKNERTEREFNDQALKNVVLEEAKRSTTKKNCKQIALKC